MDRAWVQIILAQIKSLRCEARLFWFILSSNNARAWSLDGEIAPNLVTLELERAWARAREPGLNVRRALHEPEARYSPRASLKGRICSIRKISRNPTQTVFGTFHYGRNQIELFQELKILNKKIARITNYNWAKSQFLWSLWATNFAQLVILA